MSAAAIPGNQWLARHSQLIGLIGAAIAVSGLVVQGDFLLRPGAGGVLRGLAQHGFVLGLFLVLTARSRTVSLPTLGAFWLLGVWAVVFLAYLIEEPFGRLLGADASSEIVGGRLIQTSDTFVPDYWSPIVEETLKLAPVALYLWLQGRGGRRLPSMSDGLLLGFMVGAGASFHEDAHVGKVFLSGAGWDAGTPWTVILPTVSPVGDLFLLNHAVWGALSGLSIGVAMMFRHRRWAWLVAAIGPALALSNHMMGNHFSGNILGQLGRADVPWLFSTIRSLTSDGKLPMIVLILGGIAVATGDWLILRWVSKRDRMFPPLPTAHLYGLLKQANSRQGFKRLVAAERYLRLRRTVYFAGWRTKRAGGAPQVTRTDFAQLRDLLNRAGPSPEGPIPAPETPRATETGSG
jgi:hypothetical protein